MGRILREQGFEPLAGYPGWYGIEVDEQGKRAGPVNWFNLLMLPFHPLVLFILAIGMPLVLVFWFIEELLGVPHG